MPCAEHSRPRPSRDDDDDEDNAECPGGHAHGGGCGGGSAHPMIPVSSALRSVLTEAARALVLNGNGSSTDDAAPPSPACAGSVETLRLAVAEGEDTGTANDNPLGRILSADVTMPSPGYPPYPASIMDGYAVISGEYRDLIEAVGGAAGEGEGEENGGLVGLQWTHRVAGRVYAGDYVAPPASASGDANDEAPAPVESGAEADVDEGGASAASEPLPFDEELEEKSKRSSPSKSPRKQAAYREGPGARGFHGHSLLRSLPYDERNARDLRRLAKAGEEGAGVGASFATAQTSVADNDDDSVDDDIGNNGGEDVEESPSVDDDEDAEAFVRRARQMLPTALYVTTGAIVPPPYDCVVPIEEVTVSDDDGDGSDETKLLKVNCSPAKITPGKWIRPVGCDIAPDEVVLERGTVVDAVHTALLAQSGVPAVAVTAVPRVGVMSTGNELLLSPGLAATSTGKIPDANRPLLLSLLSGWKNAAPVDLGVEGDDDEEALAAALSSALRNDRCDVLITTGGISVGEKDILERVLVERLGAKVIFGRMHMKPGKPTTLMTVDVPDSPVTTRNGADGTDGGGGGVGDATAAVGTATMRRRLIFCLPGNPVSAAVCANLLLRPCLDLLHAGAAAVNGALDAVGRGATAGLDDDDASANSQFASSASLLSKHNADSQADRLLDHLVASAAVHPEIYAALARSVKLDAERPEYHRVSLAHRPPTKAHPGGRFVATSTGVQRSSRLMSMVGADGLMILPCATAEKPHAEKGGIYPVLLLGGGMGVPMRDSVHSRMAAEERTRTGPAVVRIVQVGVFSSYGERSAVHFVKKRVSEMLESSAGEGAFKVGRTETQTLSVVSSDDNPAASADESDGAELVRIVRSLPSSTKGADLVLVVCSPTVPFQKTLSLASALRDASTKDAEALALLARTGAASADGSAALFEATAGYVRGSAATARKTVKEDGDRDTNEEAVEEGEPRSAIVLMLPDAGLEGALEAVGGLVGHAVRVGRGAKGGHGGGGHSHRHDLSHDHHRHQKDSDAPGPAAR